MDLEARLTAIEEKQNQILNLLVSKEGAPGKTLSLKDAARYAGYSPDHFRRLAVEQHLIPFARPSGQQKGKILFRKADLDRFLGEAKDKQPGQPGRRRKSKNIQTW